MPVFLHGDRTLTRAGMSLLMVLLVSSGAAGLMYEIVWFRSLGLWFGSTVPAVATVLAAFMGGLALGNLLFGRLADRAPRPFSLYRWLELAIGITSVGVSLLLLGGGPAQSVMARLVAGSGALEPIARFAMVFVLLMVPTTLMGGTLPAVARGIVSAGAQGRTVGALYAANTAGAMVGVLLPDLLLIPRIGMWNTVLLAVCLNLLVVVAVGALVPVRVAPDRDGEIAVPLSSASPLAIVLFAVSGFCAMGYEVIWSRLIQSMASGLVASFSILLATYLAATALGSWISRPWSDRVRSPLLWAALGLVLTGVLAALPVAIFEGWIEIRRVWPVVDFSLHRQTYSFFLERSVLSSFWVAALPCLVMGLAFPFLAAAAVPAGSPGRGVGRLVAVNTLAGVAGSLLAGFLLLPNLGLQASLFALAGLATGVGAMVALAVGRRRLLVVSLVVAGVVAMAAMVILVPRDKMLDINLGQANAEGATIEQVIEGSTTMAAVATRYELGQPWYRELVTPGVRMSGTSFGARRYMSMMGHLPLFFSRDTQRAALICYGVGNTARSLLAHDDLGALDIIDISPEVIALNPWFIGDTGVDPLVDPRVEVLIEDGRHHLLVTERRYDVITSEPPPPNAAGVVNLYSREYYATARRVLQPGGVLAQWLPVFQLSEPEILSMIAAFVAEFPHTALFQGHANQWILVGSDSPLVVQPSLWRARAAMPGVQRDLAAIAVQGAHELAASFMLGDADLRALSEAQAPLTDDLPIIQYPFDGIGALLDLPQGILGDPRGVASLLGGDEPDPDDARWLEELGRSAFAQGRLRSGQHHGALASPEWAELVMGTHLRPAFLARPCHPLLLDQLGLSPHRLQRARNAMAGDQPSAAAASVIGRSEFYCGDFDGAADSLARIHEHRVWEDQGEARYWALLGGAARGAGRWREAEHAFAQALLHSEHPGFRAAIEDIAQDVRAPWLWQAGPLGKSVVSASTERVVYVASAQPDRSEAQRLEGAQALADRLDDVELAAVYALDEPGAIELAGPSALAHGLGITALGSAAELPQASAGNAGQAVLIVGSNASGIIAALGAGAGVQQGADHGGALWMVVPQEGGPDLLHTRYLGAGQL